LVCIHVLYGANHVSSTNENSFRGRRSGTSCSWTGQQFLDDFAETFILVAVLGQLSDHTTSIVLSHTNSSFVRFTTSDGLAPFVSVYLVAYADVSPSDAGLVWFTKDISQMVFQVPMGAFVDWTTHKKAFLVFFTALSTMLPIVIVFTQNIPILLVKSVFEGFAATSLKVFKGPFALGIAGHENFDDVSKHTENFEHAGSLVAGIIAGFIGYFLYPDVLPIFYVLGAFGVMATLGLLLMKEENQEESEFFYSDETAERTEGMKRSRSFLDDDMARNSRSSVVKKEEIHKAASAPNLSSFARDPKANNIKRSISVLMTEEIVATNEPARDPKDKEFSSAAGHPEDKESSSAASDPKDKHFSSAASDPKDEELSSAAIDPEDKELSASLRSIFVEDPNMTFFCLAVFFFHLGNAAVLPVLGQVLALEDGKAGIPYTAANIAVAQLTSFLGVYMLDFFVKRGYTINVPTIIGFGALIPRVLIIIFVLRHSRNPYLLVSTQLFDGIGAGVNGLSIMRVTKVLTEGTNRFGVVFSVATLSQAAGAALSNLISGYLIDSFSYEFGFWFLLSPGILSVFFAFITKVESPFSKEVNNSDARESSEIDERVDDNDIENAVKPVKLSETQ
jgi:hypothetical protein